MVTFSNLVIASLAVAGSLASPMSEERGDADFILLGNHTTTPTLLHKRQATDYTQNYIAGGANAQFSTSGDSFSVTFNTNSDFVVGRGWKTGSSASINFDGSFSVSSGVGLLSIYGWTTNPLVEYYIMEDSHNPPQQGTIKGTFESDGGTYTVWEHQQTNQPSIQGTSTFQQYLSIRQSGRSSGNVTVANHFNQWKTYGMNLGTHNYQTLSVESWSGAGSAKQTVSRGS